MAPSQHAASGSEPQRGWGRSSRDVTRGLLLGVVQGTCLRSSEKQLRDLREKKLFQPTSVPWPKPSQAGGIQLFHLSIKAFPWLFFFLSFTQVLSKTYQSGILL